MYKNVLICPDSFKETLSSSEVSALVARRLYELPQDMNCKMIPLADGGEGTLAALMATGNYTLHRCHVPDPLMRQIEAQYLVSRDSDTVVIEMAQASGIERLTPDEQNPMHTTTYGTGVLIQYAIMQHRPKSIYIAVGSSATNDGGLGMLAALDLEVLGTDGQIIAPTGQDLKDIIAIRKTAAMHKWCDGISFYIINDVQNPFCGPSGAAHTYARQKGASDDEILQLDAGLEQVRSIIEHDLNMDLNTIPGAGAAGGIAGGAYAYLGAQMISGAQFVSEMSGIPEAIAWADIVITGEGCLDQQSVEGKLVGYIAELCRDEETPLVILCGTDRSDTDTKTKLGDPIIYSLDQITPEYFDQVTTRRDLLTITDQLFARLLAPY